MNKTIVDCETQETSEISLTNFEISQLTQEQNENQLQKNKEDILNELKSLDDVLPRCIEDLIFVQGINESLLPQIMQNRLNKKRELRQLYNAL